MILKLDHKSSSAHWALNFCWTVGLRMLWGMGWERIESISLQVWVRYLDSRTIAWISQLNGSSYLGTKPKSNTARHSFPLECSFYTLNGKEFNTSSMPLTLDTFVCSKLLKKPANKALFWFVTNASFLNLIFISNLISDRFNSV